ncbi:hypothetical protein [uncultured Nonlabens sp.]|uniref:OB-fold protein n=1 Tax=uncultured Nonlabens sp. TaxID=859306 RepID=UPI002601BF43|nr:hypothetical protein [uncultured Nonlabens sp.]
MNMKVKFISITLIVVMVAIIAYNHNNINEDVVLMSNELVDKATVHDSLIDKSIIVYGTVKEKLSTNSKYALLLEGRNEKNILCQLNENQIVKTKKIEINDRVKIRGIYKGKLSDLILLNCELLDHTYD